MIHNVLRLGSRGRRRRQDLLEFLAARTRRFVVPGDARRRPREALRTHPDVGRQGTAVTTRHSPARGRTTTPRRQVCSRVENGPYSQAMPLADPQLLGVRCRTGWGSRMVF